MSAPEPLLGRFRFIKQLKGSAKLIAWLAEAPDGSQVVAALLSPQRAEGLRPAIGLNQVHLATVLDVVDTVDPRSLPEGRRAPPDYRVAVAEFVPGRSLARRVGTGPIDPLRAVRWISRLAQALSELHARGAVHGAISPRSIVVSRVTRGPSPILTHLVAPPSGAYCSPERVTGSGPSPEDDVWALCATLYAALTHNPPFTGSSREELAAAILRAEIVPPLDVNSDLRELVMRGLDRKASYRFSDASALRDALEHWLIVHELPSSPLQQPTEESTVSELSGAFDLDRQAAGETGSDTSTDASVVAAAASVRSADLAERATTPPIRPKDLAEQGTSPPVGTLDVVDRITTPDQTRVQARRRNWMIALPLLMAAAGAGAFALTRMARRATHDAGHTAGSMPATPAASSPVPPIKRTTGSAARPAGPEVIAASASPASAAPTATMISSVRKPDETASACVERLLPAGALGHNADLDYLCESSELWGTGRRIHSHIARHGQGEGMKLWAFIGEYDLPAIAVLHRACCPGAATLEAATPSTACTSLTEVLADIAKEPTTQNLDRYGEAVSCLQTRQVRLPEVWERVSARTGRQTFERFLAGIRVKMQPASP